MSKDVKKLDNLNQLPFPAEIVERIKADLDSNPDVKNLPDEAKASIVMSSLKVTQYSSPFPAPPLLAEMEEALPGAGERILNSFLKMQDHGINMELKLINYNQMYRLVGMLCAISFALGSLFAAYKIAELGHPATGATLIGGVLFSVVGAFLYGERQKKPSKETPIEPIRPKKTSKKK